MHHKVVPVSTECDNKQRSSEVRAEDEEESLRMQRWVERRWSGSLKCYYVSLFVTKSYTDDSLFNHLFLKGVCPRVLVFLITYLPGSK